MKVQILLVVGLGLIAACTAYADARRYDAVFTVEFDPAAGVGRASIRITPDTGRVSQLDLRMPAARYTHIAGDGSVSRSGDRVFWRPPKTGGELRYDVVIDHKRADGAYDARMTTTWAIARGDNLFPPAAVRATRDSESSSRLEIRLPKGWTDRESGYRIAQDGRFIVVNPSRKFDRPVGWIAAGDLLTRSESIGPITFRVTGPKGQGLDRVQILSFLRVATPSVVAAFGKVPEKVLIVGANDPMWRGGLAGPRSFWLHAARKLQSENGTSALLHELTHTVTGIHGAPGEDWIVEGLAEYYSIELARRSGLLSDKLASQAVSFERRRGSSVGSLKAEQSIGARTARAVAVFADLDSEIRRKSDGQYTLDDLTRALMRMDRVTVEDLRSAATKLIGTPQSLEKLS
jgi:hypothetical protein